MGSFGEFRSIPRDLPRRASFFAKLPQNIISAKVFLPHRPHSSVVEQLPFKQLIMVRFHVGAQILLHFFFQIFQQFFSLRT